MRPWRFMHDALQIVECCYDLYCHQCIQWLGWLKKETLALMLELGKGGVGWSRLRWGKLANCFFSPQNALFLWETLFPKSGIFFYYFLWKKLFLNCLFLFQFIGLIYSIWCRHGYCIVRPLLNILELITIVLHFWIWEISHFAKPKNIFLVRETISINHIHACADGCGLCLNS